MEVPGGVLRECGAGQKATLKQVAGLPMCCTDQQLGSAVKKGPSLEGARQGSGSR